MSVIVDNIKALGAAGFFGNEASSARARLDALL
jgi:hypothetical protein